MNKIIPVILCILCTLTGNAQNWQWATTPTCNQNFITKNGLDGHNIKSDANDNLYMTGFNQGDSICFGAFTLYYPEADAVKPQAFMVKYSPSGTVLWARGSIKGSAFPVGIDIDGAGNIYEYGYFESDSVRFGNYVLINSGFDSINTYLNACFYIVKYDPDGDVIWALSGQQSSSNEDGGIALDKAGNVYITGEFLDSLFHIGNFTLTNNNMGGPDIYMAKYDSSGNSIWAKNINGPGAEQAGNIVVGNDNKVYLSGGYASTALTVDTITVTDTSVHGMDMFLARFDTSGSVNWVKTSRGAAMPVSLCADNINGVYISGQFSDWSVSFDTTAVAVPYMFAGYMAKYDSSGNMPWIKLFIANNSLGQMTPRDMMVDSCNNIWTVGFLDGTNGLILDSNTIQHGPARNILYVAAFTPQGAVLEHFWAEGNYFPGLSLASTGEIYLATRFSQEPIIVGDDTLHHYNSEEENIYCAKFRPTICVSPLKSERLQNSAALTLYPNPATSNITIQYSNPQNATASIYDITGRLIGSYTLTGNTTTISVQTLPPGIYQCRIMDGQHNVATKKLVIMH